MNYLAHAHLSFNNPEIVVGNMISDFVKGKKRFEFSEPIQKGIMLHRSIDMFTDEHAVTKKAKQVFKPVVGLYAGAFMDVVYDHFLALDANEFPNETLLNFSLSVYATLDQNRSVFPEKFGRVFYYMQQENWLYSYGTLSRIEKSFRGLLYRAKYLTEDIAVFDCFQNNYTYLRECYNIFFPEVKKYAYDQLGLQNSFK
jgi:acyl carrier protein phosphodiesterase